MMDAGEIANQINVCRRRYHAAQQENAELQARIDRLNEALASLRDAAEKADDLVDGINDVQLDDWRGSNRKRYNQDRSSVLADAKKYREDIDRMRDEVKTQKRQLVAQMNALVQVMTGCENAWNALSRQLKRALS